MRSREFGGPHSSLVTNFGIGLADDASSIRTKIRRGLIALRSETFKFRLGPDEAAGFLTQTGWTISTSMSGQEVAQRYLADSRVPATNLNRDSLTFIVATPKLTH